MSAFVDTFQMQNGLYVPLIREDDGTRRQCVAAAQPGPAFQFMSAPEFEVGLAGNKGGGKTQALIMRMLSGVGRGWGTHYNTVLLRSSLREMTDLVTLIRFDCASDLGQGASIQSLKSRLRMEDGRET